MVRTYPSRPWTPLLLFCGWAILHAVIGGNWGPPTTTLEEIQLSTMIVVTFLACVFHVLLEIRDRLPAKDQM
jgi:hypothetical protein